MDLLYCSKPIVLIKAVSQSFTDAHTAWLRYMLSRSQEEFVSEFVWSVHTLPTPDWSPVGGLSCSLPARTMWNEVNEPLKRVSAHVPMFLPALICANIKIHAGCAKCILKLKLNEFIKDSSGY